MTEETTNEAVAEAPVGIKETTEALDGVFALSLFIASRLADGAGVDDAVALFSKASTDEEFKAVIAKAYDGKELISGEVKDIDFAEGIVLAKKAMDFVPQLLSEMKKK